MTNNDTRQMILDAIARRNADTPQFVLPDRRADRSRNGQRTPRSVKHKGLR